MLQQGCSYEAIHQTMYCTKGKVIEIVKGLRDPNNREGECIRLPQISD
jgi:hypothetical protein